MKPARMARVTSWARRSSQASRRAKVRSPTTAPIASGASTARSTCVTAASAASYLPSSTSTKAPEIPGSISAHTASAPLNSRKAGASGVTAGVSPTSQNAPTAASTAPAMPPTVQCPTRRATSPVDARISPKNRACTPLGWWVSSQCITLESAATAVAIPSSTASRKPPLASRKARRTLQPAECGQERRRRQRSQAGDQLLVDAQDQGHRSPRHAGDEVGRAHGDAAQVEPQRPGGGRATGLRRGGRGGAGHPGKLPRASAPASRGMRHGGPVRASERPANAVG